MRILIVEDSPEKRQGISRVLTSTGVVDLTNVEFAYDLMGARKHLRASVFDLLILDIALPARPDEPPTDDAGVHLLQELFSTSNRLKVPTHVVGVTGFEQIYQNAFGQFSSRTLSLIRYEDASVDWEVALAARVHHIHAALCSQATVTPRYQSDLVIICALYSPELTSILRLPWNWTQSSRSGDHTIYWKGTVTLPDRDVTVHAAHAPRMGMPAAATLASKMIHAFQPKYIAMPGITAGVRGRVQLGDIIAADPCWDWGSGKWAHDPSGPRFYQAPHQLPIVPAIRERIRMLAHTPAALNGIRERWAGDPPDTPLTLHLGPVASGAAVLAEESALERVVEQHRQLLGLEMELYGVYAAAEDAPEPRPQAFGLKSVVDFADAGKSDSHRHYAAYTSAEALRCLVENYLFM